MYVNESGMSLKNDEELCMLAIIQLLTAMGKSRLHVADE